MDHSEVSARGGRRQTPAKIAAALKNLSKAQEAAAKKRKAIRRGLAWTKTSPAQ